MSKTTGRKFKAGDLVRVLHTDYEDEIPVGTVTTIVSADGGIYLPYDGQELYFFASEVELWQPKVGERVRLTADNGVFGLKGDEGAVVVEDTHCALVRFSSGARTGQEWWAKRTDIEPLPAPTAAPVAAQAQPAALKIEAGRYYKTRDGRKVGPMSVFVTDKECYGAGGEFKGGLWNPDGTSWFEGAKDSPPLVAEWPVTTPTVNVAATVDYQAEEYGSGVAAAESKPKFKAGQTVVGKSGKRYRLVDNSDNEFWPLRSEGNHYTAHFWKENGSSWDGKKGHEDLVSVVLDTTSAIVARIEGGKPRPASRPYVHTSLESANTEAKRMAGVHKGQKFGVYVLTGEPVMVDKPVYKHAWQTEAANGNKIAAIRELRAVSGLDERLARQSVDAFLAA